MKLASSADLLISQWRSAPRLYGMVDGMIGVVRNGVAASFDDLERMLDVETASGVWLDYLGARVGVARPLVVNPGDDHRFGFTGPTQSRPFDTAPFRGDLSNEPRYPLNDTVYRKFIKARAILDLGRGNFRSFDRAAEVLDVDSICADNRDMTITVQTDRQTEFALADTAGALPRPAGVRIIYENAPRFGFAGAGVGFDRSRFR